MAINGAVGMAQVTKATSQEGIIPGSIKLSLAVNVTQECSVMSDLEEHLVEEGAPVPASKI